MNSVSTIILALCILIAALIVSGGVYRTETIQAGVTHRTNILTGEIDLCILDKGCEPFSERSFEPQPEPTPKSSRENDILATYPLEHFRTLYPEYDDLSDSELAGTLYKIYLEQSGLNVSKESYFEVIGYDPK